MRTLRNLATATAAAAYALVALSPLVRITNSGLGCGEHWPLCNGHIIPPLDNPQVMIEWGHRLAALTVSVLVVALALLAWRKRRDPGVDGPGGVLRPALLAVVLLVVQVLLGAVTVWLTLPAPVVVIHLGNAMALLATVCVAALRAQRLLRPLSAPAASQRALRGALLVAALTAAALLLGALTANLGAGAACLGFPLCNGRLWPLPSTSGLAEVQWAHRLVAYTDFLALIWLVIVSRMGREPRHFQRAASGALGLLVVHIGIAATMILTFLPTALRATHAALGALIWVAMVYLVWTAAAGGKAPA